MRHTVGFGGDVMGQARTNLLIVLLATSCIALLGCENENQKGNDGALAPAADGNVIVTGEVLDVVDQVPVDGGVTISVTTSEGITEQLLFPSLFTYPPPSEETIKLYDLVRRVEVGDVVRAEGKRTENGVELLSLTILSGRP
jgi:hypothetical protein